MKFEDDYGVKCSLQESSSWESAIWLGVNNAHPKIMWKDAIKHGIEVEENCGWVDYPIPKEVLLSTRMHLTQNQVRELLPYLQRFVETGLLYEEEKGL